MLHSSVSLPMQSLTDPAASQEPFSCELTLLVIFMLYAHLRLHPTSSFMVYWSVLPCGILISVLGTQLRLHMYTPGVFGQDVHHVAQ